MFAILQWHFIEILFIFDTYKLRVICIKYRIFKIQASISIMLVVLVEQFSLRIVERQILCLKRTKE